MQPSSRMPPSVIHPKKAGDWRFGFIVVCVVPRVAGCSAWHVAWGSRARKARTPSNHFAASAARRSACFAAARGTLAARESSAAALPRGKRSMDLW